MPDIKMMLFCCRYVQFASKQYLRNIKFLVEVEHIVIRWKTVNYVGGKASLHALQLLNHQLVQVEVIYVSSHMNWVPAVKIQVLEFQSQQQSGKCPLEVQEIQDQYLAVVQEM